MTIQMVDDEWKIGDFSWNFPPFSKTGWRFIISKNLTLKNRYSKKYSNPMTSFKKHPQKNSNNKFLLKKIK
jgi:hypothetical protein